MRSKEEIRNLLAYFRNQYEKPIQLDEEAMFDAYRQDSGRKLTTLPIKILSVFGGLFASIAFLGFLFIAGLHDSPAGMLVIGGVLIVGSVSMNKINPKIILDTMSVSFFMAGFMLLGFGSGQLEWNSNLIFVIFIILAIGSLVIAQNYILSFVSVLIISGSLLALIISNQQYYIVHVYVCLLVLTMYAVYQGESRLISLSKSWFRLFSPLRIGLIFSFLTGLFYIGRKDMIPFSSEYIWISSVPIFLLILHLISKIIRVLGVTEKRRQLLLYIFALLVLLPTTFSPAISGSLLILLLSFYTNHKTGLVIGIVSFVYFISQYYYDLNFTLLTKSILLFSTGLLFIGFYLFTHKKLTNHDKV